MQAAQRNRDKRRVLLGKEREREREREREEAGLVRDIGREREKETERNQP